MDEPVESELPVRGLWRGLLRGPAFACPVAAGLAPPPECGQHGPMQRGRLHRDGGDDDRVRMISGDSVLRVRR